MKPEPCEFSSAELVNIAVMGVQHAMIGLGKMSTAYTYTELEDVLKTLLQASAQNEHCGGRPTEKDPWDWEDADTYGPSA